MAGSPAFASPGALPGMGLYAWVCFAGASGAVKNKSATVTSVVRNGAGDYTINLSAMADTNAMCHVVIQPTSSTAATPTVRAIISGTNSATVQTAVAAALTDAADVYVGVYR